MAPPDAVDEVVDVGKKSAFSWVNVARKACKAVACAVVLLIFAVSVYAVVLVCRRGELDVFVVGGGSLSLWPTITNNSQVQWLSVEIELDNDGGRGTIYYAGVTAKLVERKNTSPAAANTIVNLPLGDIIVEQQSWYITSGHGNTTSYGEMFLRNYLTAKIAGAAPELILILHGNLTTNLYALYNRTSTPTTYNCYNVTVGGSSENHDYFVKCQKSAAAKQLWLNCSIFLVVSLFLVINTEY